MKRQMTPTKRDIQAIPFELPPPIKLDCLIVEFINYNF